MILLEKLWDGVQAAILGGFLALLLQALVGSVDRDLTVFATVACGVAGFLFGKGIHELLGTLWSGVWDAWSSSRGLW